MTIIGITGPTGAGKTTALQVLARMGAVILDCDRVYHELTRSCGPMRAELLARFGPDIFAEDGTLRRKTLGAIVFEDQKALDDLNDITHRYVRQAVEEALREAEKAGKRVAAVDAVALLESGLGELCRTTVAVTASDDTRVRRVMAREGIGEEYARLRVSAQKPAEYFEKHCDHVLRNDGEDRSELEARAWALFDTIIKEDTAMEEKTAAQQLRETLLSQKKNGWDLVDEAREQAIFDYCESYKTYLDRGKTERTCVAYTVELAKAAGFVPLERGMALQPGMKVYRVNRGRAVNLAVIGSAPLDQGVSIVAAHIDSPRLDLKPTPLYENSELAFFKTHYYGGIRKYQWVTIPLELRGVVALKDGAIVNVSVGGNPGDPQFTIDDLLPHLAADQSKKTLAEAIPGENLNLLVGSRPLKGDEGSDRVKLAVMKLLHDHYGITEADFISAELEAVPAFRAADIGFDRTLLGAYGHDDRVCAYAGLKALLDLGGVPCRTAVCVLADKEEIGSEGVSGMQSAFFDTFVNDLCDGQGVPLRACLERSFCLSCDVTAAYDPNFAEVYEKNNSAWVNRGVGLCKYTGARGKSGASDAGAEAVAYIRRLLDDRGILWQMSELGKVDQGGGGTVACYMAKRNIDTLDAGVPVLSMHSPFETVSKLDCYMTYAACKAVYEG